MSKSRSFTLYWALTILVAAPLTVLVGGSPVVDGGGIQPIQSRGEVDLTQIQIAGDALQFRGGPIGIHQPFLSAHVAAGRI